MSSYKDFFGELIRNLCNDFQVVVKMKIRIEVKEKEKFKIIYGYSIQYKVQYMEII